MENNTVTIPLKDKVVVLQLPNFEEQLDMDELTRIDYSNLYAELLTVPTLMNRVGLLKAEADNAEGESRLARDIKKAELSEHFRKVLSDGKKGRVTNGEVEDAVILDPAYQAAQRKRLRKGKEAQYIDSLYWSVKSKEQKLNKIGERMNLTPEDFEKNVTEGTWNGILIKSKDKLIK